MRYGLTLALLLAATISVAQDEEEAPQGFFSELRDRTYVSGTLEIEGAYQTHERNLQKVELILQPTFEIELPAETDLTIIPRFRFDTVDRLEPGVPDQREISGPTRSLYLGDRAELELREFYFERFIGDSYITLGKQQIVWGKADGLKVLDVVNPQNYREFTLDDFDDSRIPLWAANVEIPVKAATLQLIWIPDQSYHQIPEAGAVYELNPRVSPTLIRERFERPGRFFRDSEFGIKLSGFWKGWDLSLNYLYHYDDIPVLNTSIAPQLPLTVPPTLIATLNPRYERTQLYGGSFSNAFGDLTLRGEFAFSTNRQYATDNPADSNFIHQGDEFGYVLGFDWYGFENTLISLQVFQNRVLSGIEGLLRDRTENRLTLLLRRTYMNDTLELSMIAVHGLNDDDGYVRPKIAYDFRDDLNIWIGTDIFYGNDDEIFGQFDDTDRVLVGMEWGF